MFKREDRHGKFIGYSLNTDHAFFFFGSRYLPRTALEGYFPEYEFAFLKQVHGKKVVAADPSTSAEADAHFTDKKDLALISQTADCVPILLASDDKVCAIHSGWKSAAQNIIAETKSVFGDEAPKYAAIGPHILMPSFEVGMDVGQQLLSAAPAGTKETQLFYPHNDSTKIYFDLAELVRLQIMAAFGPNVLVLECLEDTKTSIQFHSFRRDRERAERQYSFVVLKS